MEPNTSKIAKIIVVVLILGGLLYGGYYIYQNTKVNSQEIDSQVGTVIVVPSDILDNKSINQIDKYTINGSLPIKVDNAGKPNPFAPMQ